MTIGGGSNTNRTSTTTPLPAAASPLEQQQQAQQGALNNLLSGQVQQQNAQNQKLYQPGIQASAGNLNAQLAAGGLGTASPQQLALIQQQFAGPQQQALTALQRAAQDSAAARGMSISDSPVNTGYLQQVQNLLQNIAGQQAGAGLQYGQQGFQNNQQMAAFGQNLNQAANQGLMNAGGASGQLANALTQQRLNTMPVMQRGTQNTPTQFGANIGQVGQGLSGLAQAASTPAGQSVTGGIGNALSSAAGAGGSLYNNIFGQSGTGAGTVGGAGQSNTGGSASNAGGFSQPYGGMSANQASWFQ